MVRFLHAALGVPEPRLDAPRPRWVAALLPAIGLVVLVLITGLYGLNRTAMYGTVPKSSPPAAKKVGDDFARVAELTRDPRSINLVVGQALYDQLPDVGRIIIPRDLQGLTGLVGPKNSKGLVSKVMRASRIMLLTGVEPTVREYTARLSPSHSEKLLATPGTMTYPMGVVVVPAPGGDSGSTDWALVGDYTGQRIIIAPAAMVPGATP